MARIEDLKRYNSKLGELKRLQARMKLIDLKLENWDKLKAATISDMPIHHDTEHGDKIGDIVASREDLNAEKERIELEIAELNCFIIDVDSRLDQLEYAHSYLLTNMFKLGLIGKRSRPVLHEKYIKDIGIIERQGLSNVIGEAIREFNKLK